MLGASILDMPRVPPGVGDVLVGLVGMGWKEKQRERLFSIFSRWKIKNEVNPIQRDWTDRLYCCQVQFIISTCEKFFVFFPADTIKCE